MIKSKINNSQVRQLISAYGAFNYELTREKRRAITISVKPDQSVSVKAPPDAKESAIETFVRSKLRWILKHQRRYANFKPIPTKKYVAGENLHYLGKQYRLTLRPAEACESVAIRDEILAVCSRRSQSELYTRHLVERWYEQQAQRVFQERLNLSVKRIAPDNPPALAIRRMKSRLGSYSSRTHRVCLNLNLIMVAQKYIDYIIIHELCHITHLSHDAKFYALQTRYLPEWRQLENELRGTLLFN